MILSWLPRYFADAHGLNLVNAGYASLWVDVEEFTPETATKLLSLDPVSLGALENGKHQVTVELFQNNKVPFDPPVRATVEFRVGKGILGVGDGSPLTSVGAAAVALLAIGALWLLWQKGMLRKLTFVSKMWGHAKKPFTGKPPISGSTGI